EGRPASRSSRMRPSSHLRHVSFAVDPCVADDGPPQPQTATCCTALQRGFAPDSRVQQRYAPVRTPGSAALLRVDENEEDQQPQSAKDAGGGVSVGGEEMIGASTVAPAKEGNVMRKAVRKWKSTVEDVDVSQLTETPRLRRSGGMRRDWSFENLRGGNNAA
uniref:Uncharacterized protein n=4 Tax=Setaria TaxID=4554 RepID=K3YD23_SETIT